MRLGDLPEGERWLVVGYCAPQGIPPSIFLGRVLKPGVAQWLEEDWRAILDWHIYHCGGCGHDTRKSAGPGEQDKWNAEKTATCDVCRAQSTLGHIMAGSDDLDPTAGALIRVWRDDEPAA